MAKDNVTLGDGLSDIGYSYFLSVSGSTDIMSAWNPPSTYLSGGYTSGTTASTDRPAVVTNLQLRLGGTYDGYSGNADGALQLSTESSGSGGVTNTYGSFNQTGTTKTFSTGTIAHPFNTTTTYLFYGVDMASGTGGNFFLARSDGTGQNIHKDGTLSSFNGSLSGQLTYQTIPSKPVSISAANVLQTTFTLNWTAPLDDGVQDPSGYSAANINGYRISYKANASSTWSVLVANTGSSSLSYNVTGLTTNTKYDFQVSALNDVTDVHVTSSGIAYSDISAAVGERSNILTFTTLASAPKVWNGSAWTNSTLRLWNGSTWVNADIKVWNGSAWTPLIL